MAFLRSFESFSQVKLLTPMDLVKPNLLHSSMAFQVPSISKGRMSSFEVHTYPASGLIFNGQ